jgi:membrane protease YdiL (CAAX protease family)
MEALLPEAEVVTIAPPRHVSAYPTLKESWAVLGWFLLVSLVVGVPLYLLFKELLPTQKQLATILISVATETALIFFLLWKVGSRRPTLQLRGHELPWLYIVLPVLVIAQLIVLSPIQYLHLPNWAESNIQQLMERPVLAFFMLCVVAPVLEETIFRGVLPPLGGHWANGFIVWANSHEPVANSGGGLAGAEFGMALLSYPFLVAMYGHACPKQLHGFLVDAVEEATG